jgi:hypothetical protein
MIIKLNNERNSPPFPRYGGKATTAAWYRNLIPRHHTFVEAFCGSAALLFSKVRSKVEVLNDRDDYVCNFFTVLRDPTQSLVLTEKLAQKAIRSSGTAFTKSSSSQDLSIWSICRSSSDACQAISRQQHNKPRRKPVLPDASPVEAPRYPVDKISSDSSVNFASPNSTPAAPPTISGGTFGIDRRSASASRKSAGSKTSSWEPANVCRRDDSPGWRIGC